MPRGRSERTLKVIFVGGPTFEGWKAKHVFLDAVRHISKTVGLEEARRYGGRWIRKEAPEHTDRYEWIDGWWVRSHASLDHFVGVLAQLKEGLRLPMRVEVRTHVETVEAELLS